VRDLFIASGQSCDLRRRTEPVPQNGLDKYRGRGR
jgi:hypothetical protein